MSSDYQDMDDELEEGPSLRLKESINLRDLCSNEGFNIEIDTSDHKENDSMYSGQNSLMDYSIPPHFLSNFSKQSTIGEGDNEGSGDDGELFEVMARKMEDIASDGGVKKKVLRPGTGACIKEGFRVKYHYSAYLEFSDEPFDSSIMRKKPETTQPTLLGLLIALRSMRKKEKAQFLIKPEYLFGKRGCPPRIPGDATILYEIEVIDVFDYVDADNYDNLDDQQRNAMPFEKKMETVTSYHRKGNGCFKDHSFSSARSNYRRAIRILEKINPQNEDEYKEVCQLLCRLHSNSAMASLELHEFERCCDDCQRAFKLPGNFPKEITTKLYYRYSKAKIMLGDFKNAHHFLTRAERICPNNDDILKLRELYVIEKHKCQELDKVLCQKMFSKPLGNDCSTKKEDQSDTASTKKEDQSDTASTSMLDDSLSELDQWDMYMKDEDMYLDSSRLSKSDESKDVSSEMDPKMTNTKSAETPEKPPDASDQKTEVEPTSKRESLQEKMQKTFETNFGKQLDRLNKGDIEEFKLPSRLSSSQHAFVKDTVATTGLLMNLVDTGKVKYYRISLN